MLSEAWRSRSAEEDQRFKAWAEEERLDRERGQVTCHRNPSGPLVSTSQLGRVVVDYLKILLRCSPVATDDGPIELLNAILSIAGDVQGGQHQTEDTMAVDEDEAVMVSSMPVHIARIATPPAAEPEDAGSSPLTDAEYFLAWFNDKTGGLGGLPILTTVDVRKMLGAEGAGQHSVLRSLPRVEPQQHIMGPQTLTAIMANISNHAEPGEDLDWTKLSDPRERKRLQSVISSRKYNRKQRLAAEEVVAANAQVQQDTVCLAGPAAEAGDSLLHGNMSSLFE